MAFVPYWMNPARAKEAIEAGQAIVLDVTSQFIEGAVRGRIPGAVWVSPREILNHNRHAADVVKDLPGLSRDKTIIAYCTCPDEEASARLTRVLKDVADHGEFPRFRVGARQGRPRGRRSRRGDRAPGRATRRSRPTVR